MKDFIHGLPKAELHLHIEGTLEPEMMMDLANRNKIKLHYQNVQEIKDAYHFENLQEFLDLYYQGMSVLLTYQDFYDLTWAYLVKCADQNIVYTEMFFDPQAHLERGVSFETVLDGIYQATQDAEINLGVKAQIILSILRHLEEQDAEKVLDLAILDKDRIIAIGLDSSELGNPPEKFERVYQRARLEGFYLVAHAGEEGGASYVSGALHALGVDRIDHGNNAMHDENLLAELRERQIALTLCPLSNFRLQVVTEPNKHPLKEMFEIGLKVTINSDDPAYFGGYLNENYVVMQEIFDLSKNDLVKISRNAFESSFLSGEDKAFYLNQLKAYVS